MEPPPSPGIGFMGGISLLISSITGPGLTTIPLLFQEAGWLLPTIVFIIFALIAGLVSSFLIETMAAVRGNERFQSRVEYSTVVHLYMGDRAHRIMQLLLFCTLQSINMSSIIIAAQTMDSILVTIAHKSCALSFSKGFVCAHENNPGGSPFNSYIVVSLGYIMSASMVIPLSLMTLVQNVKFQIISAASLAFIICLWVIIFLEHGLPEEIPIVGINHTMLVGFVLNNFAFITTIPSFVNELDPKISIRKVIWYSIITCVLVYLLVGFTGAASLKMLPTSDILSTLSALRQNRGLIILINIMFPVTVLVTSVPVFAIVIRYNLVRGGICSEGRAKFLASVLPWILIIPFQTKGWLLAVMNWSSLIFASTTNYVIPLVLFIISKRRSARSSIMIDGDMFVQFGGSIGRRSSHIVRRAQELVPSIITSSVEGGSIPLQDLSPPTFTIQPPGDIAHDLSHALSSIGDTKDVKDVKDENGPADLANEGASVMSLGSSSTLARYLYSTSVSQSGSVTQSDRPTDLLAEPKAQDDAQLIPIETTESGSRIRSNSFEARPQQDGTVHRRNLSRNNSSDSTTRQATSSMENIGPMNPTVVLGSSNLRRRLTIEEVAEDSEVQVNEVVTFKALPESRWINPLIIAEVSLVIVIGAVVTNIVFAIMGAVKSHSFLSS